VVQLLALLPVAVWAAGVAAVASEAETAPQAPAGGPGPAAVASSVPAKPAGEAQAAAHAGIVVNDSVSRIEFALPAKHWLYLSRTDLAARTPGGCAGGGAPASMLAAIRDKDAPIEIWVQKAADGFLMRDRQDLETFVGAFVGTVKGQVGATFEPLELGGNEYVERDGMVVHRFAFSARPSAGRPGCGGAPAAAAPEQFQYVFVDYFVRPKDSDAMDIRAICLGPAAVLAALRPEVDGILSSLRYTGPLAAQFFAPDAATDKVPGPKAAARSAGGRSGIPSLLVVAALIIGVWFLMSRRKRAAA
jgi:hypothetical protein